MMQETVNILGNPVKIIYNPTIPGAWELAVARAALQRRYNFMSRACSRTSGVVGELITLKGSGSSGSPPFTIIFKKDNSEMTRFTSVPRGTQKTLTYTLESTDVGTRRFQQEIIDAAGQSCNEYCDVTVIAPAPVCDFEVS